MSWTVHSDIAKFFNEYESYLLDDEARNNMFLQVLSRALQNPSKNNFAFSHVSGTVAIFSDESVVFDSADTTEAPTLIPQLTEILARTKTNLKRAMANERVSRDFVRSWLQANKNSKIKKEMSVVLQKLDQLNPIQRASGMFRRAWIEELDLLSQWTANFMNDTGAGNDSPISEKEMTLRNINNKNLFIWGNPKPVCMVGVSGSTPKGIRINCVYTPDDKRGKGYAASAVAAATELQLSQGKEFVVLYSDATKPNITRLYEKIGFDPIDNHFTYFFTSPS